jgi:hypothetical protein
MASWQYHLYFARTSSNRFFAWHFQATQSLVEKPEDERMANDIASLSYPVL